MQNWLSWNNKQRCWSGFWPTVIDSNNSLDGCSELSLNFNKTKIPTVKFISFFRIAPCGQSQGSHPGGPLSNLWDHGEGGGAALCSARDPGTGHIVRPPARSQLSRLHKLSGGLQPTHLPRPSIQCVLARGVWAANLEKERTTRTQKQVLCLNEHERTI
jgi:hypothetical protein